MAKNIIEVILKAKNQLGGPLSKAGGQLGKFGKSLGGPIAMLAKLAAGATAAAAAAAAAAATISIKFTKEIAKAADASSKLSTRLGVSTQALNELGFLAERSGVPVQNLNVGLQRMTRRLAEVASTGGGVAAKTLETLGVRIDEIQGRSPDEQFLRIAKSLSEVSDQGEKVRLAFSLFDTEGVGLLQTMEGGADAMQEVIDRGRELGAVFSEDLVKSSVAFQDAQTDLSTAVRGAKAALAEELLPVLTKTATQLADFLSDNREAISEFGTVVANTFSGLSAKAGDFLEKNGEDIKELLRLAATVAGKTFELIISVSDAAVATAKALGVGAKPLDQINPPAFTQGPLLPGAEERAEVAALAKQEAERAEAAQVHATAAIEAEQKRIADLEATRAKVAEITSEIQRLEAAVAAPDIFGNIEAPAVPLEELMAQSTDLALAVKFDQEQIAEELELLRIQLEETAEPMADSIASVVDPVVEAQLDAISRLIGAISGFSKAAKTAFVKDFGAAMGGMLNTLNTGFAQSLVGLQKFSEVAKQAWKSFVSSAIAAAIKLIAKLVVVAALQALVSGGVNAGAITKIKGAISAFTGLDFGDEAEGKERGGIIRGVGRGDTVPILATPGEAVLTRQAVSRLGRASINMMNAGGSMPAPAASDQELAGGRVAELNANVTTIFGGREEGLAVARQIYAFMVEEGLALGGR